MIQTQTSFYSDGFKLDASFYAPDSGVDVSKPLFITCSGFQGLNNIHPARYARALTKKGYECFGFDYRGFARSEGDPGDCLLEDQVRDIANAVEFVRTKIGYSRRLVLAGWGMGAGLILDAAKLCGRIDGLVSINGFYDAMRVQKALRSEKEWTEFQGWYHEQKQRLTLGASLEKHDPFRIYPLDPETTGYVDGVLRKNPDFGIPVLLSFADSLLQFRPEATLEHLHSTPILIAHGDRNKLHPVDEAESLFKKYPGKKELYWIQDAGHTEWMYDDNPRFVALSERIDQWLKTLS